MTAKANVSQADLPALGTGSCLVIFGRPVCGTSFYLTKSFLTFRFEDSFNNRCVFRYFQCFYRYNGKVKLPIYRFISYRLGCQSLKPKFAE